MFGIYNELTVHNILDGKNVELFSFGFKVNYQKINWISITSKKQKMNFKKISFKQYENYRISKNIFIKSYAKPPMQKLKHY